MLKVYLVRHAQSTLNKQGIKQGSDIDSELSEEGLEQVKKLVDKFKKIEIDGIYCSNLKRSFETAKIIGDALNLKIKQDDNLRELKIGDWSKDKIDPLKRWIEFYESEKAKGIPREDIRPPNGENSWDHIRRIMTFLNSIENIHGNLIVIAHSGTNKVIIGEIQGTDPDNFYTIKQENCCVNELEYDGKKWSVVKINDTSHFQK